MPQRIVAFIERRLIPPHEPESEARAAELRIARQVSALINLGRDEPIDPAVRVELVDDRTRFKIIPVTDEAAETLKVIAEYKPVYNDAPPPFKIETEFYDEPRSINPDEVWNEAVQASADVALEALRHLGVDTTQTSVYASIVSLKRKRVQ